MEFLPPYFVSVAVFILGLIIGSFLDVVVTRFNTGASLSGRSRCLSCGRTLRWFELVPFVSYLILRGRCERCHSTIPVRLLCTEVLTAVLFLFASSVYGLTLSLCIALILICVLILVVLYDYNHMVIPHFFVYLLLAIAALYLAMQYMATGEVGFLLFHCISAVGSASFFGALWLVSKGRWIGLGDAKLAFALGFFLSPVQAVSMIIFSFWIGAAVSIALLALGYLARSGKKHLQFFRVPLTIKSEVPFAPFLVFGFICVFLGQVTILTLVTSRYAFFF